MKFILLVDDDATNRLVLSTLFEDYGFKIETASSFKEAEEKIASTGSSYDVVLLDQHLGDGLGTDLVPSLRAQKRRAKIILMSGSIKEGAPEIEGFDGVAVKGIAFLELLAMI
jgi:DNA-binding response OmpR family regulator